MLLNILLLTVKTLQSQVLKTQQGWTALRKHYTLYAFHITLNTKIITTLFAPSMRTATQYMGLDLLNEDARVTCFVLFCHQKYSLNNAGSLIIKQFLKMVPKY